MDSLSFSNHFYVPDTFIYPNDGFWEWFGLPETIQKINIVKPSSLSSKIEKFNNLWGIRKI